MIGQYQHNIDAKGRLFIPAKYREELGETFYVTIGLDGCLSVYSDAKWGELTEKYDALPISQARKMRTLFANAAKCEPDSQGRSAWSCGTRSGGLPSRTRGWTRRIWLRLWKSWDSDMDDMEKDYGHKPVLLEECLEALAVRPEGIYLDGTLGRAGHSLEILRRLTTGRLIGVDRDLAAIEAARERLAEFEDRVTLVHGNFSDLGDILQNLGIVGVDGMLFDLGVSSPQLDEPRRGFSYMHDAPLDMRMDETAALDAFQVVNTWSYEELRRILFEYGEERYAPQIARAVVRAREDKPVGTTGELAELIRSAMPSKALREKQHPAKRSFQAIRIAVNGELDALPPMLDAAAEAELAENPRARSAKLRAAERTEF